MATVAGALSVATAAGLLLGGTGLAVARATHDDAGYLMSDTTTVQTSTYAVTTDAVKIHPGGSGSIAPKAFVGNIRIRVTPTGTRTVFVGIATARDAGTYLAGVKHTTLVDFVRRDPVYRDTAGGPPAALPSQAAIWTVQAQGTGTQELTWSPRPGDWVVVVMNAAARPGVAADVSVGAQVPALGYVVGGLFVAGIALAIVGAFLLVVALAGTRTGADRR